MQMGEYQMRALSTALEQALGDDGVTYCVLKLNGEAGEIAEKLGKQIRGDFTFEREDAAKEIGDVLWYVAVLAWNFGYSLDEIARINVEKLASRKERGVLKGSGDDR